MQIIILETAVYSSPEICFDLSRSIDLHKQSTAKTKEEAIAGVTKGLIQLNETVTWRATHLGIRQNLTSKITAYQRPYHFRDEQIKGAFRYFKHDHYFEQNDNFVVMRDIFEFESPLGTVGKIVDALFLKKYLSKFLIERNSLIKEFAETEKWKEILN